MKKTNAKGKPAVRDIVSGTAWAWLWRGSICYWACPTVQELLREGKPSPEAEAICVSIIPRKEYRRLRAAND